ncbi:hypothetical protein RFI_34223, partial [Reticulomyxa filosa]
MKSLTEIKNDIIPTEQHKYGLEYHCFVPLTINNEKVINHFILFCKNTGLLIKYDEQNKIFNYEKLPICPALSDVTSYSFVHLYDFIFLFGGKNTIRQERIKKIYKYSMKEKTWNECKLTLPMEISASLAILSDDNTNVHVIGGRNIKDEKEKMHVSVNVDQLFEKAELLKMIQELKKEIKILKLERSYTIPIEKERMIEDEKKNNDTVAIPEECKKMKTQ